MIHVEMGFEPHFQRMDLCKVMLLCLAFCGNVFDQVSLMPIVPWLQDLSEAMLIKLLEVLLA